MGTPNGRSRSASRHAELAVDPTNALLIEKLRSTRLQSWCRPSSASAAGRCHSATRARRFCEATACSINSAPTAPRGRRCLASPTRTLLAKEVAQTVRTGHTDDSCDAGPSPVPGLADAVLGHLDHTADFGAFEQEDAGTGAVWNSPGFSEGIQEEDCTFAACGATESYGADEDVGCTSWEAAVAADQHGAACKPSSTVGLGAGNIGEGTSAKHEPCKDGATSTRRAACSREGKKP